MTINVSRNRLLVGTQVHEVALFGAISCRIARPVSTSDMLRNDPRVYSAVTKQLDAHLLLLDSDQSVQLAQNGLHGGIATLVVVQELLHILQGMS